MAKFVKTCDVAFRPGDILVIVPQDAPVPDGEPTVSAYRRYLRSYGIVGMFISRTDGTVTIQQPDGALATHPVKDVLAWG